MEKHQKYRKTNLKKGSGLHLGEPPGVTRKRKEKGKVGVLGKLDV